MHKTKETINFANEVVNVLTKYQIPFSRREATSGTVLTLPRLSKNDPDIELYIHVTKTGDSQFIAFPVRNIPEHKIGSILTLLNTMHNNYRYVTFILDEDGDIRASYDVLLHSTGDALLYTVMNSLRVFLDITDSVMKTIKEELDENTQNEDADGIELIRVNLFEED